MALKVRLFWLAINEKRGISMGCCCVDNRVVLSGRFVVRGATKSPATVAAAGFSSVSGRARMQTRRRTKRGSVCSVPRSESGRGWKESADPSGKVGAWCPSIHLRGTGRTREGAHVLKVVLTPARRLGHVQRRSSHVEMVCGEAVNCHSQTHAARDRAINWKQGLCTHSDQQTWANGYGLNV